MAVKSKTPVSGGVKAGAGKIVSKDEVVVNLAGVTARERKTTRIAEGNYRAKVKSAETFKASTGNAGVKWVFVGTEGEAKGVQFYYNTMLGEASIWSFRGVLQALAPKVKIAESAMKIPLGKLVGRTCALEIVDGEYEGKIRSEINDVFSEELLEEDEDEDEEEDEESDEEESDEEEEEEDDEEVDEEDEEDEDEEDDEEEEVDLDEDEL